MQALVQQRASLGLVVVYISVVVIYDSHYAYSKLYYCLSKFTFNSPLSSPKTSNPAATGRAED